MADIENDQEQKDEFNCTISVEDSGSWKKKVSVQIPREEIDKELNKQYGEIRRTADVPGFRKGHAPRRLIEKRFGGDVSDQVKLRLLAQAFEQIDDDQDFEILGEPDIDPEKIELPDTGDLAFDYEVEVKPEFEIPELEGVKVEKRIIEIDEKRVNEALEELRLRKGHMEEVQTVAENDMVRADVTMKVEGVEESQLHDELQVRASGTTVMGVWVQQMAEVLEGAKVGDTRTVSAKVPETHEKEEYRDKEAHFTIKVKVIERLIPAELNEEFLASMGQDSEEELRRGIQESLENQVDREIRGQMAQQVYKYLDENVEFELPSGEASRYADRVLARRYYEFLREGFPQEQLDENMEKLRASSDEQASRELKMNFVMERVAEKLDIEVSEAEVNGFINQIAISRGRRPERVREQMQREGQLEMVSTQIRDEKAIDRILEMAEVVDAPAETEKKPAAKTPKKKKKTSKAAKKPKVEESADKNNDSESVGKKPRKEVKRKSPEADKD